MLKTYFQAVGLVRSLIFQRTASFPHQKWQLLWCEFFPHQRQKILTCFLHSSRCLIFVLLYFFSLPYSKIAFIVNSSVNLNPGIDLCSHHHRCDTALSPQNPPSGSPFAVTPRPNRKPWQSLSHSQSLHFREGHMNGVVQSNLLKLFLFSLLPMRRGQVIARINNSWSFHRWEVFRSTGYAALFTHWLAVGYLGGLWFGVMMNRSGLNFHFI